MNQENSDQFFKKVFSSKLWWVVIAVVIVLGICLCINKSQHGVWGLPFLRKEVAVIKTTDKNDSTTKYYKLFSDGSREEIGSDFDDKAPNPLYYFDKKFTEVRIVQTSYPDISVDVALRKITYFDVDENEYEVLPEVSDPDLKAITEDFFEQWPVEPATMCTRLFRDGDKIYIATLRDSVWTAIHKIYVYDMKARKLKYITQISEDETVD